MNLVHDLKLGDPDNTVNTVTEIPKGSMHKIEYDLEKEMFILDRVEPGIFVKPVNYGFIPQTLDEDGDPLDTLIITEEPIPTGVLVEARVLGILNFIDDEENDHKIICVPEDDRHAGDGLQKINDLPEVWKNQITHHFSHYKDLKKPGSTIVEGFEDNSTAWEIIMECHERYKEKFNK